ncbi:hypothetical protein [Sphaerotilus hippei]|uniref:hypothetical protein n=1 Tax=Sphaerotilus hippei TaxID=744406 RepID=UPI000D76F666|nr:hypothetical protein [Sphaerotilus hippei]
MRLALLLATPEALALAPRPGAGAAAAAPGWQPVARGIWSLHGEPGDSSAANQGATSNLLAVRHGTRLWLLGSGPDARYTRRIAARLQRLAGGPVTDVIAPWPRAELVLGQAGLSPARCWAHADVAAVMRVRCPRCVNRLAERRGRPADPGTAVRLPDHLLQGARGTLGPFSWQLLQRGEGTPVTVWALPRAGLACAHGLLWGDGPPDLRDAGLAEMVQSTRALQAWRPQGRPIHHWLPEQGPWLEAADVAHHLSYWQALEQSVADAQARGRLPHETDAAAATLAGLSADRTAHPRHELNRQRVWRLLEDRAFDTDPAPTR